MCVCVWDRTCRTLLSSQDKYATAMFEFLSEEQEYTENIQDLVKLQMSFYKQAATTLETLLPQLEKKKGLWGGVSPSIFP